MTERALGRSESLPRGFERAGARSPPGLRAGALAPKPAPGPAALSQQRKEAGTKPENLKVVVRLRPLLGGAAAERPTFVAEAQEGQEGRGTTVLELDAADDSIVSTWTFDRVYDERSDTEALYTEVGAPLIARGLEGYNGTIFAYGAVHRPPAPAPRPRSLSLSLSLLARLHAS